MRKIPAPKTLSSIIAHDTGRFQVRHDTIVFPNGVQSTYDVIEKPPFVIVIAKERDNFFLVEQYRYPIKRRSWEFVAGSLDVNESPKAAAVRELREETGLIATKMTKLGIFFVGPGHHAQQYTIFLAENFIRADQNLDESEADLIVKKFPIAKVEAMVKDNTIVDSPTAVAMCLYILNDTARL